MSRAKVDSSIVEIEHLARTSYELVLDLLPDNNAMPTVDDAREAGLKLLQNLKCIRLEAKSLRLTAERVKGGADA
jgi:hypothetical protein